MTDPIDGCRCPDCGQEEKQEACDFQPGAHSDPWAHRSKGMRCRSCMWWVKKGNSSVPNLTLGRCRRHAPTMSGFPVVYASDWCGDHRLDEQSIS